MAKLKADRTVLLDFIPDTSPFFYYLSFLMGPFFQEDAAVLLAATLSAAQITKTIPTLICIYLGLFVSDAWKYWLGWAARKNEKASSFAEKKHIAGLEGKVQDFTLTTLFAARFVPLTRVPIYVACGFFRVNYLKYCFIIALTAAIYVTAVFLAIHLLDNLFGDRLKWVLLIAGLGITLTLGGVQYSKTRKEKRKGKAFKDNS